MILVIERTLAFEQFLVYFACTVAYVGFQCNCFLMFASYTMVHPR